MLGRLSREGTYRHFLQVVEAFLDLRPLAALVRAFTVSGIDFHQVRAVALGHTGDLPASPAREALTERRKSGTGGWLPPGAGATLFYS